jgi:YidC/Oxa1 family membrane protein insertase
MDDSNSNRQDFQKRFLIAIVLSIAILAGWTYFFPPPKPAPNNNSNSNTQQAADTAQTPAPSLQAPTPAATYQVPENAQAAPQKIITIDSPLYTVKLDARGAVPISWVIKKHRSSEGEKDVYSIASTKGNPVPLELISQKGLENSPREVPLRILTGDAAIDAPLNENAYQVNAESDDIHLNAGESKTIEFTQTDAATGLEAVKKFTFRADSPVSDLQVKLTKNGQVVPGARISIGPSIGDQGIKKHYFYRSEPEATAFAGGDIARFLPTAISEHKESPGHLPVNGITDWAGIGDAYFAMAVVPQQPAPGVEFTGTKYDQDIAEGVHEGQSLFQWVMGSNDRKETRHLTTAWLPITADGSVNKVFVGAKDHFAFASENGVNHQVNEGLGRTIDLENMINYGWYAPVRFFLRPIAVPILWSIAKLNELTGSYGIAIIIFTFVLYSAFFPLKMRSAKSMKKAQKHQPRMKEIQDQMKKLKADDPKMRELQMEQLRLMKESNFLGGCLPMVLQIPFFIALYTAITISLDFRQATFLWLPDLSASDPFHLLEFAMSGSMVLSMVFAPAAPAMTPEQQMQQKMMSYLMPVMMLWVLWGAPAGLLLYWFIGNLVTFGQQMVINRMNKSGSTPAQDGNMTVTPKKMKPKLSAS